MSRRLLVLGCGYIGAEVCRRAPSAGWVARGVVRSADSASRLRAEGLDVVALDVLSDDLNALGKSWDAVVYALSAGGGGDDAYRAAYAEGPVRVSAWAARAGAKALVLTSSTGVYRQDGEVDESSPAGGDAASDRIVAGEQAVLNSTVPSRSVLRLGGLYGPGRHYLLDQLRRGERTVGGRVDHRINYLHRDDAASAVLAACAAPSGSRVLNVTDGQPVTKEALARWICARLGGGGPIFDPSAPAGPRARRSVRAQPDRVVRADRIRKELGWKPIYPDVYAGLAPLL
jgi:nucleoside-diphosphate-sugar epimerase